MESSDPPAGSSLAPERTRSGRRRRSRGGRRASRSASHAAEAGAPSGPERSDDDYGFRDNGEGDEAERGAPSSTGEERDGPTRRSRRRRRGRSKKGAAHGERQVDASLARQPDSDESAPSEDGTPRKRRRRGTRGGRRRRRGKEAGTAVEIEAIPGEDDELPEAEIAELPDEAILVSDETGEEPGGRRKRERRRGGRGEGQRSKRSRGRARVEEEPEEEDDDLEVERPAEGPASVILVNAIDPEETRVAVVTEGRITDLQMTVQKRHSFVSDIYRGRVVNLEPAIGAAFVDFGQGRNGFLHASDVLPSYGDPDWSLDKLLTTPQEPEAESESEGEAEADGEAGTEAAGETQADGELESDDAPKREPAARAGRRGRGRRQRIAIDRLLKKGQMVVVQITKDAIGDKGPTLTTHISIPGRYLVLMPSLERTGVSRKIDDDRERRRLKRILSGLDIPEGMGVIVRTAGVGKTKSDIKRDLDYLLLAWEDFSRRLQRGRNPAPLYQESDVAVRTMRDLFNSSTEKVVVDEDDVYQRMVAFTEKLMPENVAKVQFHKGPRPLFHGYGVEQDFERIFARRVELPSGGSIVIDQTEALVAIDVNSGRTREEGAEFEDIALKTNLEAVDEIARQIRLRDLGGIIVLDYIDMMRASGRRAVERATREAFKKDRARSKIGRISQFGLLELTRQRLGPGLSKLVYESCPRCRGSGRQRNASSRAQAILRRLGAALTLKGFTAVEGRAHPEVTEHLRSNLGKELERLEQESGRSIVLLAVPDQVEDSVLHYLRADGREVRPGGRRKR